MSAWTLTAILCACVAVASLAYAPTVDASRVLAIETIPGKSHWNFMSALLRTLTHHHDVTVFTPFPEGDRANYTEVDLSPDMPLLFGLNAMDAIVGFDHVTITNMNAQLSREHCDTVYGHRRMVDILNGVGPAYDVVVAEFSGSECASYAASRLGLPLIYLIPSPMISQYERIVLGHMSNPATTSHMLAPFAVPKTFAQRFTNLALLAKTAFVAARMEAAMKSSDPRPYDTVQPTKASVVFMNTHYATDASRPMPPNVVQVGGIHLKPPRSVPDNILEFIESSPHGVIYLTFGSVITMSTLSEHISNEFKEALEQVPQRVLWKYEGEMKNIPKNVMTSKWFPQRDILMHPKVKLFISHGGISGVYEAVDAGVPVLGFPLFYDQPRNIDHLVEAGMAISMDLMSVQKDQLLKNVLELVNNDKYMKNAKIASKIFKDRPMSPEQLVVYWTEYVIRHKGAPHLKSPAFNLTWYQYFLLDVIGVVLFSILLAVFIISKVLKIVFKYFSKNKQRNKVKPE